MTTPTSAAKNPNNAAKSRDDGKCALGGCSLMKAKIQLIPLRYGIVERLDPSSALAMPYKLESRPLGIRLIRDGWLYVIVEKKPEAILHEYRVQNGIVTQLLWEKSEIKANKRESNVGEATLVFPRLSKLYVNYSEVQWTAAKCAQVIKHKPEREYFMQKVDLTNADPEKGAPNLLTASQAEKWIAEISEQPSKDPAVTGAKPEESKDYLWEQKPTFKRTQLGALKKQVSAENERDHLYLVVQDDLGVLRDLAEHQNLVAKWTSDWSEAEANQKKYVFGCYIESLYTVTDSTLSSAAKGDPRFTKLNDETSPEQRQSIVDYVNVKNQTYWTGVGTHKGAIAASKMRMRTSLGPLYPRYEDLIESIEDNADDALNGAKMGQNGINDLVDRPGMEAFLKQQRTQLSRWNKRLDSITNDRNKLFCDSRFYRAAWYFDPNFSNQLEGALETEYSCLKDICRTQKVTEAVADFIEKLPGFGLPTFFTLSHTDQSDMQAKLSSIVKSSRDMRMWQKDLGGAKQLSTDLNGILSQHLHPSTNLSIDGITLDQLRNSIYEPAKQLRLANAMEEGMQALRNGQQVDPNKILRKIPGAAWLNIHQAFGNGGVTLEFASPAQLRMFESDLEKLIDLRKQMSSMKNQIRQTLANERRGRAPKGSHRALVSQRKNLQQMLAPLEVRVAQAYSPVGEGPSKAGIKLKGLSSTQLKEFENMVEDHRLKRPFKGLSSEIFQSRGADLLATAVAVMQIRNFAVVSSELFRKETLTNADKNSFWNALFSMSGGVLAASQGISVTSLSVSMKNYASVTGKLGVTARLGYLTGYLGFFAYASGATASAVSLLGEGGSYDKWVEAVRDGNGAKIAGAGLVMAGDSGQVGMNSWAAARTSQMLYKVYSNTSNARAVAWLTVGGRLVSVAARANLIGLALTVIQLGGEFLYNKNNLSKLDKWLRQSPWGVNNANKSLLDERLDLAEVTASPQASLQKIDGKQMAVIDLPNITAAELDEGGFEISAYWLNNSQRNDWEAWSEPMLYQLNLLSKPTESLKLGFEILPHEANAQHGLAIELQYRPLAGVAAVREKRFETLTLNAEGSKAMAEVTLFRARTLNAPRVSITTEILHSTSAAQKSTTPA
jgi:hypothetical protein